MRIEADASPAAKRARPTKRAVPLLAGTIGTASVAVGYLLEAIRQRFGSAWVIPLELLVEVRS